MRACAAILVSLCVLAADAPKEDVSDKERMQGAWWDHEFIVGGKSVDMASGETPDMILKGDEIYLYGHLAGHYKIDPTKKPPTFEYTIEDRRARGFGDKLWGVYKLESDALIMNFSKAPEPRPTDFQSRKGTTNHLFLYRRKPIPWEFKETVKDYEPPFLKAKKKQQPPPK